MAENQWGELFDIIDKYEIDIPDYNEANESLEKDIERMSKKSSSKNQPMLGC